MTLRYRKKPVEIDALEWTGSNIDEATAFIDFSTLPDDGAYVGGPGIGYTPPLGTLDIPTLEGVMTAQPGDWIIRGVKGEYYPCKPDIFSASYTKVDDTKSVLVLHIEVPDFHADDLDELAGYCSEPDPPTAEDRLYVVTEEWMRSEVGITLVSLPGEKCSNDDFEVCAFTGRIVGAETRPTSTG